MCRQLYFYNHLTQVQGEGAIHKWRHPLGEGGLAKRWCYSISQFGKMGDKGGVKNLKKNERRHLWMAPKKQEAEALLPKLLCAHQGVQGLCRKFLICHGLDLSSHHAYKNLICIWKKKDYKKPLYYVCTLLKFMSKMRLIPRIFFQESNTWKVDKTFWIPNKTVQNVVFSYTEMQEKMRDLGWVFLLHVNRAGKITPLRYHSRKLLVKCFTSWS